MNDRLASKNTTPWLPLAWGSVAALLAIGACSVDKSKYTFIPDDQFNSTANAGTGNGNPNGGGANPNGGGVNGDSGATNSDAGTGNTGNAGTGNGGAPGTCI